MDDCKHKWKYSNLHDHFRFKLFLDRECKKCGRKEHRNYLGGDMFHWEVTKKGKK